ncbi:YcnI family copper-binding membrane protein [Duganella callida]|uniref:DUF1775 domain-containing protein n=1 Tax=Duganella callida TaxID=2561932 RepID=A0A4Y9SCN4_9BURK|nr:YcnI family protein [Duganella callida]TFW18107.1 DUF1775 domain-containing protein [Duganella callida]
MKKLFPLLWLTAAAAQAHVTLDQSTGNAGSYQKLAFRVGHGCDGKATTGLTITLPEGAGHAKPMPKPGWKIAITDSGALHEISWSGGELPDAYFDEFVIQTKLPDQPGKLYFRVVQQCGNISVAWDQIAGDNMKAPAPALDVLPAAANSHSHH